MAKRILVVDDENDARMFVKLLLENSGFKVVVAPGGKEALKILKKEKFCISIIILSIHRSIQFISVCLLEVYSQPESLGT